MVDKVHKLGGQQRKSDNLEDSLARIQRLHDTMAYNFPDGVIGVLNRDLRYVLIDGKDLKEMNLVSMRMIGPRLVAHQDTHLAPETLDKLKSAFEGEKVKCEVDINDKVYELTAVPLPDDQDKVHEILCVLQNVTKRKRMEEGLVKALEREKELGELKSRFVTMASHEFRTPLTAILSSTFLLENYVGQDFDREKIVHTNRIKRAVNNLTTILNEFLSLEKLEENKVRIVSSEINIPEYMNDIIWEMEVVKRDGQIMKYDHNGPQNIGRFDHHLLGSIVTNLISNALKYSKPGDNITVATALVDNDLKLTVSDQGIGIPADEHKFIFGRFYRASNATNIEGTGLGLHIVQKYVHLLKGTIAFESDLNQGTTFTVVLPGSF